MGEKIPELEKQKKNLEEKIPELEKENDRVTKERNDGIAKIKELEDELKKLPIIQDENEKLKKKIPEKDSEIEDLKNNIKTINERNLYLTSEKNKITNERDQLDKE